MIPPTESNKGVAKWSLVADDNANSDDRINWAEGMYPSAVNDSARMMMARIREQHDINQAQFKSILDTVGGRFGNQIKEARAESYTIDTLTSPASTLITFYFGDGTLTADEHDQFLAGKLHLYAHLLADKIEQNAIYQTLAYNSIIAINLNIKIGNNQSSYAMQFRLNFFGIEKANDFISFHELQYFVNRHILITGHTSGIHNTNALPMTRSYTSNKTMTPTSGSTNIDTTKTSNLEWYYISPTQCICTHSVDYPEASEPYVTRAWFSLGTSINIIRLKANPFWPSTIIDVQNGSIHYQSYRVAYWALPQGDGHLYSHIRGNFTFMITGTPTQLKDYPMILEPTATNSYPIIV